MNESESMELNETAMRALLEAFDRSDWQEMTVIVGGDRLQVSRRPTSSEPDPAAAPPAATAAPTLTTDPAPVAPVPAPSTNGSADRTESGAPAGGSSAAIATATRGTVVESPSVGLFWRAPSPTSPPFVEVGGRVEAGDTVAIVEVMKLMNHVSAPVAGVVTSILVDDGATVEYGQPLVAIDAAG